MRTSVEITEEQRLALTVLAKRRGLRGFSPLVQEAIDRYLADQDDDRIEELLALQGSITDEEAEEMLRRIAEARASWRDISS
jgi:hypothetical protein